MTTETNTTTETTTTKDADNNAIITTTTTTTEEYDEPEELDFDFDPNKQLNEALEKQRQEERECLQRLIAENVRLEKESKKAQEDAEMYKAKCEALQAELKSGSSQPEKSSEQPEPDRSKGAEFTGYEKEDAIMENYRLRIQDLEVRLEQLADDDRMKDKVIENLSNKEAEVRRYMDELEAELGPERVQHIQEVMQAKREGEKESKFVDRSQIVRQGQARSAICAIM